MYFLNHLTVEGFNHLGFYGSTGGKKKRSFSASVWMLEPSARDRKWSVLGDVMIDPSASELTQTHLITRETHILSRRGSESCWRSRNSSCGRKPTILRFSPVKYSSHPFSSPHFIPASMVINTLVDERESNRLPQGAWGASPSPCCLYLERIN